jgi:hypothetical protein
LSQEPKFLAFSSTSIASKLKANTNIHLKVKKKKKTNIQKNEEENHGPPRVRHSVLKLECKQEREGEEQAMGHKSLKSQGHSPPAHHPPPDQHSPKKQKLQELYPHQLQRTKNPFLRLSRE